MQENISDLKRKFRIAVTSFAPTTADDLREADLWDANEYLAPTFAEKQRKRLSAIEHLIDKTAKGCSPDIILLSEFLYDRGLGEPNNRDPQTSSGNEYAKMLIRKCIEYRCCIVANQLEPANDGQSTNTSTFYGRKGEVVYKYHKMRIPLSEYNNLGIVPGPNYNAFDTEFGRLGMVICLDVPYPEVIKQVAEDGAELVLVSTIGEYSVEVVEQAKLNNVYIACSGSDKFRETGVDSAIIANRHGEVLVGVTDRTSYRDSSIFNAPGDGSYAFADIDLDV
jgi:predicted amidohydrolase